MIPVIDIYTLTDQRNKETIDRFLAEFTNRPTIEDLKDGELMLLPKGKTRKELASITDYAWQKAETLTKSIEVGLAEPDNCFTLYLMSNYPEIDQVILTFTQDNKLILGLSVIEYKDEAQTIDNYGLASLLCNRIKQTYHGTKSYFGLEAVPADNEKEFDAAMKIWRAAHHGRDIQ